MRIYVAGRTNMLAEVRRVQEFAKDAGHTITYDWTANVEEEGGSARERHVPPARQVMYANADRMGVLTSDCTIVVCGPDLCGTLIECGIALALGKITVVLYGKPEKHSVFFELPEVIKIPTEFILRGLLMRMSAQ